MTSILSEKYFADVVLMMLDSGTVICGDIEKIVSSPRSRELLIRSMKAAGIVTVIKKEKPRKTYYITLTNLGKKVAGHIKDAQSALDE